MDLATRHQCSNRPSVLCDRGPGKGAPSGKCRWCKSVLSIERGVYAVFTWRGDGRYSRAAAHREFRTERAADRFAEANAGKNYVTRWLFVEAG